MSDLSTDFSLTMQVEAPYVRLSLYYKGELVREAYSLNKQGTGCLELDMAQAISYAAHMLYKLEEQAVFGEDFDTLAMQ